MVAFMKCLWESIFLKSSKILISRLRIQYQGIGLIKGSKSRLWELCFNTPSLTRDSLIKPNAKLMDPITTESPLKCDKFSNSSFL